LQFIFKEVAKPFSQVNVKMSILLDNILQNCPQGRFFFLIKKIDAGAGIEQVYPNSLGKRMWFNLSSLLGMCRVMYKYMRVR